MKLLERRLLRITDQMAALAREEELIRGELDMHRHIHDDAERDAAVSPGERGFAYESRKDVATLERALASLETRRLRLEKKRRRLLERLNGGSDG